MLSIFKEAFHVMFEICACFLVHILWAFGIDVG